MTAGIASDRMGTACVLAAWILATAPSAGLLWGLWTQSSSGWFYFLAGIPWVTAAATVVLAAVVHARQRTAGHQIAAWTAVVVALLCSLRLSMMDSL
jgi:hypothetical protein